MRRAEFFLHLLKYRGWGTAWGRDIVTGEMDTMVKIGQNDQISIGKRAAKQIIISAHLDGTSPINPYTREALSDKEIQNILSGPRVSSRSKISKSAPTTIEEWKQTNEYKVMYDQMAASKRESDLIRQRMQEEEDIEMAETLQNMSDSDMQLYIEPLNDLELRVEQQLQFSRVQGWTRFETAGDSILSALRSNNDSHFWNQASVVAYHHTRPMYYGDCDQVILGINAENLVFAFEWKHQMWHAWPQRFHALQMLTMDTVKPIVNNEELRMLINDQGYVNTTLTSPIIQIIEVD